jgi:hypothetical protein
VRRSGRATAREPGRALGRPGRRAARYPSSSGGADTTPGSRQQRDHHPHPKSSTGTARTPTDAPTPPRSRPHYSSLPRPTRLLSVASSTPLRSLTSSPAHLICLTPIPAGAPPEATPAPRLGWPVQVLLDSRGRGVRREAADAPSSKSPGGKPRKHPKAGRRPVALMGETHRAKQMEGNTRRETGVPPASAPNSPAPGLGGSTHSTSPWALDRVLEPATATSRRAFALTRPLKGPGEGPSTTHPGLSLQHGMQASAPSSRGLSPRTRTRRPRPQDPRVPHFCIRLEGAAPPGDHAREKHQFSALLHVPRCDRTVRRSECGVQRRIAPRARQPATAPSLQLVGSE